MYLVWLFFLSQAFLTEAKSRELRGEEIQEPSEVEVAREELKTLQEERMRTEHLRDSIEKELLAAKEKAAKIEEVDSCTYIDNVKRIFLTMTCSLGHNAFGNFRCDGFFLKFASG